MMDRDGNFHIVCILNVFVAFCFFFLLEEYEYKLLEEKQANKFRGT